jgi:phosphoribosylformylglycinamidine cyclo-ligase
MPKGLTYRDAGVDVARGDRFASSIQRWMKATQSKAVIPNPGGFAGLYRLKGLGMKDPVLVSSTDGVGTKLKIGFALDRHDTVGVDLVAMCVNDLLVTGARPLFFLDYIVTSKILPRVHRDVVKGITDGCKEAGCALIGGETAEHPGDFPPGEYDLAGFTVGAVERPRILGKERVRKGDVILGLESSGIHSNGFSLARKVLVRAGKRSLRRKVPGSGETVGEALLRPTRIYVKPVLGVLGPNVHAAAHITGGGIVGNIPRVIPRGLKARLEKDAWDVPPIFPMIQEAGGVSDREMERVFNMGIGFVLVVARRACDTIRRSLVRRGMPTRVIGEVT